MNKIWIYKKIAESDDLVTQAISLLPHEKEGKCYIYMDSERDLINYQKLKKDTEANKGILVFLSLTDISDDCRTVTKEINGFLERGIMVGVLDYPSTFVFSSTEVNHAVVRVLLECYAKERASNLSDIRLKVPGRGRKKIPYPEGWDELYWQWKDKKISAVEFMKKTKLKKGTFYHLVKDYEVVNAQPVIVRKIV